MPQRAHTFRLNCCLKVHNVHLNLLSTDFGISFRKFLCRFILYSVGSYSIAACFASCRKHGSILKINMVLVSIVSKESIVGSWV